jgi:Na+-transporting NADH:ubiquinone oxidoreductase subunit A
MGWLAPGFDKFSVTYFFLLVDANKKHDLNTNLHGEERPFVMTGQYEKFFHGYLPCSTFKINLN